MREPALEARFGYLLCAMAVWEEGGWVGVYREENDKRKSGSMRSLGSRISNMKLVSVRFYSTDRLFPPKQPPHNILTPLLI